VTPIIAGIQALSDSDLSFTLIADLFLMLLANGLPSLFEEQEYVLILRPTAGGVGMNKQSRRSSRVHVQTLCRQEYASDSDSLNRLYQRKRFLPPCWCCFHAAIARRRLSFRTSSAAAITVLVLAALGALVGGGHVWHVFGSSGQPRSFFPSRA